MLYAPATATTDTGSAQRKPLRPHFCPWFEQPRTNVPGPETHLA